MSPSPASEKTNKSSSSFSRPSLSLRGQLIFWFILFTIAAVGVGIVVIYLSGVTSIQQTLGQTYCQIGSRLVSEYNNNYARHRDMVSDIAGDVLTTDVVLEADTLYRNQTADWTTARISRLRRQWQETEVTNRPKLLHSRLSNRLSVLAGLYQGEARRFAVYDRQGVLIGASRMDAARTVDDHAWFKAVVGSQEHFSYIQLDRATQALGIVAPVWGSISIIGYVHALYDFGVIAPDENNIRFGETGASFIVDYAGVPLTGQPRQFLMRAMSQTRPEPVLARSRDEAGSQGQRAGLPYWVPIASGAPGELWPRLACVAPMGEMNLARARFGLPPWSIIVTQSPVESYQALRESISLFAVIGAIGVLLIGLGGTLIAWRVTAPLKDLHDGVRRVASGDLKNPVRVSGAEEISQLATEFNRMAERVSASQAELEAFAQAVSDATDAILMTDANGVIYYINPAFSTVTGYTADEVIGKTPSLLGTDSTRRDIYEDLWGAIRRGEAWRGEITNKRKNGEEYPVDLTVSPIFGEDGEVVAMLGVHRDITLARSYREELEKEVAARTREIFETEGLTAMGRMASMIAHDLRNSLSTVKMNLQILSRRHTGESDVGGENCRMGLDQVRYMEEIMKDMLNFARPEKLRSDWHHIDGVIDEALVALTHTAAAQSVDIIHQRNDRLPMVYCDRLRMTEVLHNLTDNALKSMPSGGTLSIDTHLLMDTPEMMLQVHLRDTGLGISAEELVHVFEPFFTTRAKGTGLGLAIVKRIIVQHGGTIQIESVVNKGTNVTFTLPTSVEEG